jgi:hypothetical protein
MRLRVLSSLLLLPPERSEQLVRRHCPSGWFDEADKYVALRTQFG